MVTPYDYAIILLYLGFIASIGIVFRRFNRGTADYFAGGFRMTWWLLGASSFNSNFSCWSFTGAAQMAYSYGMLIFAFYFIDALGYALSFAWFAPRYRQLRVVTVMESVRMRYGRVSEQFFTWLGFLNTLGVAVVWMISLAVILSSAFHLPGGTVIVVTGVLVVFIALIGGNWAVAASDFVQLIVLFAVTLVVAVLTLCKVGGIQAFVHQIPGSHWRVFHPLGSIPYDWVYLVTGFLSALYMKNNLLVASRYLPAKDSRHARLSALVPMMGYLVMPVVWLIPPLAAFTLVPNLGSESFMTQPGEAAYIAVCLKILPQGMIGLMVVCMLSATIGSMGTALNKSAGIFVKSFYRPVLRPKARDAETMVAGKAATAGFGVLIVVASLLVSHTHVSLFDSFLYLAAYLGMPLAVPLFLGIVIRRVPAWAGWATALFAMALTAVIYAYAPTESGRALLAPWVGDAVYHYTVSNKFVMTTLVGAPVSMLFFWGTRLFYRPSSAASAEPDATEFFRRLHTPVDFEREVGKDNSAVQAKLIGRLTCIYGGFIALLVFIPNPWWGRLCLVACSLIPLAIGGGLLWHGRRASPAIGRG